jgi:uncharacterized protein (DUF433 family)
MTATISHKNKLGAGFYTAPDIARFLGLPRAKVTRYLKNYWDDRLGNGLFNETYSWQTENLKTKAVNFYVLIELHTFFKLQELGVSTKKILTARETIAKDFNVQYPFASSNILSDGKGIWFKYMDNLVDADGSRQTNFQEFLIDFLQKIDFDGDLMAERFYPAGKDKKVVIDPRHQFGQPVISGTNLNTEVVFNMFESGEPVAMICHLYDISEAETWDAIHFHQKAA